METIKIPNANFNEARRPISYYKGFDWSTANKEDAVNFARAEGFKETGMSVNECSLLYECLEISKPKKILELGRNYGTSTRLFMQHIIRHGGAFNSWDLKHWPGFLEIMAENGYDFTRIPAESYVAEWVKRPLVPDAFAYLEIGDSIKSPVAMDCRIDFLLIDTEHATANALYEYGRWRKYLNSGAMIAFHDSTLPGVARAIELIKEVEFAEVGDRFIREYVNEQVDGYGVHVLEWKG